MDSDWDEYMIAKDDYYKCGIESTIESPPEARIINGRSTSNEAYPWLTRVTRHTPHKRYNLQVAGGTIVSDRIILTCIHCVCIGIQTRNN